MGDTNLAAVVNLGRNIAESGARQSAGHSSSVFEKKQVVSETAQPLQTSQASQAQNSMKDVELKFVQDKATNKMMVFIVDKASQHVLRSIPPEELEKLSAGDLMEIAA
jgi:uncharacterized FlaG/YvyC family protein